MGKSNPLMHLIPGYTPLALADEAFLAPGRRAARAEKRSLQDQEEAQGMALQESQKERRRADEAYNAANRKQPDVSGMLLAEQDAAKRQAAATLLTGAFGVDPGRLKLGRKTLLGA